MTNSDAKLNWAHLPACEPYPSDPFLPGADCRQGWEPKIGAREEWSWKSQRCVLKTGCLKLGRRWKICRDKSRLISNWKKYLELNHAMYNCTDWQMRGNAQIASILCVLVWDVSLVHFGALGFWWGWAEGYVGHAMMCVHDLKCHANTWRALCFRSTVKSPLPQPPRTGSSFNCHVIGCNIEPHNVELGH